MKFNIIKTGKEADQFSIEQMKDFAFDKKQYKNANKARISLYLDGSGQEEEYEFFASIQLIIPNNYSEYVEYYLEDILEYFENAFGVTNIKCNNQFIF